MSAIPVFQIATLALVGAGMVLLGLSARRAGALLQLGRRTPFARTWKILRALMVGFAASYLVFVVLVLLDAHVVLAATTGLILGAGGIFVFLVTRSSHLTLSALAGETLARRHVSDIVDALSDGIILVDRDSAIVSVNRRMIELSGAEASALRGASAAALLGLSSEFTGRTIGRLREGTLRRRGGPPIAIEVQYVEIRGEDGESRTGLYVVRDRREAVRRELQLESAVKATEAALRARHELHAILAADVRPRLAALRSALEALGGEAAGDGSTARQQAQEAAAAIDSTLAGLVDAEGPRGVVTRVVDVDALLVWASGALQRIAPAASIEVSLGPGVNPRRCGRESTLREILLSVGNHLVGAGEPTRLGLAIEVVPGDDERLLFRVTGEGLAPASGGLGLTAARLLVQTLGGALRSIHGDDSTVEVTFTALLPAAGDEDEAGSTTPSEMSPLMLVAAMAARSTPHSMIGSIESRGAALVVDDSGPARELLGRLVRDLGYTVEAVASGQECLDVAARRPFDLILLDLILPDINGIDVITALRSHEAAARTAIVVVSAIEEIRSVAACLERGADDFLSKPVNPIILRARLHGIHENQMLSRQAGRQVARLEEEIRRADGLLRAILPAPVADELQTTGAVVPRRHADVVVLFADIVGFTAYCDGRPPEAVLVPLQALVRQFEALCRRHGVLKVKTVGDALIACSGLLDGADDAVTRCLDLAFALHEATARHPEGWRLRIGVHRGPVVAGVVGSHQFSYDIWGDTVNTAQRIEQHGVPGEVCVSERVRRALPPGFAARGVADVGEVKGKGHLEVFVIERSESRGAAA